MGSISPASAPRQQVGADEEHEAKRECDQSVELVVVAVARVRTWLVASQPLRYLLSRERPIDDRDRKQESAESERADDPRANQSRMSHRGIMLGASAPRTGVASACSGGLKHSAAETFVPRAASNPAPASVAYFK
jgi:hypothetical protein